MSANNNAPSNCNTTSILGALDCGSGVAANTSAANLLAALVASGTSFAVQIAIFLLLRLRLSRIYRPRSYLVPEKERVPPPPPGIFAWLEPLFNTPNLSFIQKCGLDAYFFLRYLRMLLKIFVPLAIIILPILLPINNYSGSGAQTSLDKLSMSNIAPKYKGTRLWAHLLLALVVIVWVCYVIYRELRGYIRVRQAFLTSPQHRIRASATTVLVTGIPRKWLTTEALGGLYDVFPGGIRNIWINRNYDDLAGKVSYRNSLAKNLEDAETNLIKMCRKKHERDEEQRRKEAGKTQTKQERLQEKQEADQDAQFMAQGDGVSAGDQHDHPQDLQDALQEAEQAEDKRHSRDMDQRRKRFGVLGDGIDVLGLGLNNMGKGVGKIGRGIADDFDAGLHKAVSNVDQRNIGKDFVMDDELYRPRPLSRLIPDEAPPRPPPKTPIEEREARWQALQRDGSGDTRCNASPPNDDRTHPAVMEVPHSGRDSDATPMSEKARMTGPSADYSRLSPFQIEDPQNQQRSSRPRWKFWENSDRSIDLPSPQPHTIEGDEFPLSADQSHQTASRGGDRGKQHEGASASKWTDKLAFWQSNNEEADKAKDEEHFPDAFKTDLDEDQDGDAYWRRYLEPKERETMRIPIFSPTWCPSLPLIGKKVDRIYWHRRELARMNLEIEIDQANPDKFPLMNSAFIQFNHQVAAHMACQSVSHHIPQYMAPRLVEISPDDIIWTNMSIVWWERYLRVGVVLVIAAALIILYAIPVSFASVLSKLSTLAELKPFAWISKIPKAILTTIEGVAGPAFLALILTLIPIIFRSLVKQQGVPTGTTRELGVQQWYFAFLFIQVFLVVSLTGGITVLITSLARNPTSIFTSLGTQLPKASDYFFYYLLVQALSTSASSLLQTGSLVGWFLLGPLLDSTARAKWRRQTTLPNVTWGSFFPPFTNFAVIGIVYSVIAPLILVFMLLIFGLFWITFRYNVLYVYQFRNDTGGLLFPAAVNQLFVGLYTMELCLIGFFLVARGPGGNATCIAQGVIMVFALIFTILYQWLLNSAFDPLFRYLPITLEDEAVIRDEEFARAQAGKFAPPGQDPNFEQERDIQEVTEEREQMEMDEEKRARQREMKDVEEERQASKSANNNTSPPQQSLRKPTHLSVNQPSWKTDRWRPSSIASNGPISDMARLRNPMNLRSPRTPQPSERTRHANEKPTTDQPPPKDVEALHTVGDVLFSGFADELEDLTPDERDLLVRYAFQHAALRAKRPVVWIPRDRLGVSDDEIRRAEKMSTVRVYNEEEGREVEKTNIWMSNEGTALDGKGKVVFRRSPPDFSNVDLIAL